MRTFLFALAGASLMSLTACNDSGSPEAEGANGATAAAPASGDAPVEPDTPVSDTPAGEPAARTAAASRNVDSDPPDDECGASKVAQFVSQEATPAVRSRLAAEVGHDRIRWVGPDTVVTMDFRPDRLNVALDANGIITGGKCA